REQDHEQATYASRIRKEEGRVPWGKPARDVKNHVRAMTEWPGAQTAWQPRVKHDPFPVLLVHTEVLEGGVRPEDVAPGSVVGVGPESIDVACGEGVLRVLRLRPAGGRAMGVKDFLNARRVVVGDRFR
ncbi:MAG: methionyl-tRNA formyltransferase, partial [Planctomycetota bacterium]